ncbi:Mis12-domain-containing protein [Trametopsis cervina]|nr:Mis12-domain-containing protein [Trametopsis cervina]
MALPPPPGSTTPSVLLPELLGFVPQFLLDDIVDTANDAVKQAVDAMEQFLERWAEARREKNQDWDSTQEIEQGLVAFQTLLNSHVDIAFDFFETWSLRNIFAVPPDLPLVAPHQAGLELDSTVEEETALLAEIKELRRKINAQRKLERLFTIAVRKSTIQRSQSERRLEQLQFLQSPQMQTLLTLPDNFLAMYDTVTSLPPHDASDQPAMAPLTEPGKRQWETHRLGYSNWAIEQLLLRTKEREQRDSGLTVDSVAAGAMSIASAEHIKATMRMLEPASNFALDARDRSM